MKGVLHERKESIGIQGSKCVCKKGNHVKGIKWGIVVGLTRNWSVSSVSSSPLASFVCRNACIDYGYGSDEGKRPCNDVHDISRA